VISIEKLFPTSQKTFCLSIKGLKN